MYVSCYSLDVKLGKDFLEFFWMLSVVFYFEGENVLCMYIWFCVCNCV